MTRPLTLPAPTNVDPLPPRPPLCPPQSSRPFRNRWPLWTAVGAAARTVPKVVSLYSEEVASLSTSGQRSRKRQVKLRKERKEKTSKEKGKARRFYPLRHYRHRSHRSTELARPRRSRRRLILPPPPRIFSFLPARLVRNRRHPPSGRLGSRNGPPTSYLTTCSFRSVEHLEFKTEHQPPPIGGGRNT